MFVSDLDDTLFYEIDYVHSGYRAIGRELEAAGIMSQDEAVGILMSAATTAEGFDNLSARIWLSYPATSFNAGWMVETYRFHTPDIRLREGAREMLSGIRELRCGIGIITDGRSATQRAKIKALGLHEFIDSGNIIISGEIGADKTTRIPFDTLMSRNPHCNSFTYLGDNPAKDFRWPNAMGWNTIEILDAGGIHIHPQAIEVPSDYRARHTVASLSEVLPLVVGR